MGYFHKWHRIRPLDNPRRHYLRPPGGQMKDPAGHRESGSQMVELMAAYELLAL